MSSDYPEGDNATARTIREIKAQALDDAIEHMQKRMPDLPRVLQPGYFEAERDLLHMSNALRTAHPQS